MPVTPHFRSLRKSKHMKTLATIALTLAITAASSASYAGDNRCLGTVTNQPGWRPASLPVVVMIIDDQDEEVCRFDPTSKVGQQILRKCPRGSTCEIALPLPRNGDRFNAPQSAVH